MQLFRRTRYLAVLLILWLLQLIRALMDNPLRDSYEAMWATAKMSSGRLLLALILIESLRQAHRLLSEGFTRYRELATDFFDWTGGIVAKLPLAARDLLLWVLAGLVALEVAVLGGGGSEAAVLAEFAKSDVLRWSPAAQLAFLLTGIWASWVLVSNQVAHDSLRPYELADDCAVVHLGQPISAWQRPLVMRRLRRLAESTDHLLVAWRMPITDPVRELAEAEAWLSPATDRHFLTKILDRLFDLQLRPPRRAQVSVSLLVD